MEESNNLKVYKFLPELIEIDGLFRKSVEKSEDREKGITKKYRVKIEWDDGAYIVSVGKQSATFYPMDSQEPDWEDIQDKEVRKRILGAGKEKLRSYEKWYDELNAFLKKLGWCIHEEDEYSLEIEKDGLVVEIASAKNYKEFIVRSDTADNELGHVARHQIFGMEAKKKELSNSNQKQGAK